MTRVMLLALLLLADTAWGQAFPTVAIKDTCVRADTGPPPSGSWVTSNNSGHKVVSNVCVSAGGASTGNQASSWNTSYGPDMEVEAKVSTLPSDAGYGDVYVRLQTAADQTTDQYQFDFTVVAGASNDTMEMWKRVSGVWTQLGATISLGADVAVGDRWGGRIVGSGLEIYLNRTSKGTRTDSDITTAGYAGVVSENASTYMAFVDFYAGTYVPPTRARTLVGVGQ